MLLAALLVLGMALRLTLCRHAGPSVGPLPEIIQPQGIDMGVKDGTKLYETPFDWDLLNIKSNHYSYVSRGRTISKLGVDVSEHNASIDWPKVKADGVSFAYIRIGYRGSVAGNIAMDARFKENFAAAQQAGLSIGVYFFSQATTVQEAREEADFVAKTLAGANLAYPVAFDMEPATDGPDRLGKLTSSEFTAIAKAFCERCESNGYRAVIYGNQYDLSMYDLTQLRQFGYWYAEYDYRPTMDLRFGLWQYTTKGEVDGIRGTVDLDLDLTQVITEADGTPNAAEGVQG